MSGLVNVAVILAVVVVIVARQVRPQLAVDQGRWWLVPAVLAFFALRRPDVVDHAHPAVSGAFLAVEVAIGLVVGAAWAWTSRMWTEPDGSVWVRGTKATLVAWVAGTAVRAGLAGLAALAGVHQGSGAMMLALAASLLTRSGFLFWRAQAARGSHVGVAYGAGVLGASWKDSA